MKKALLTTTALVALNSAAFASSVDTPNNSASSTHHTHSDATIVFTGDAHIKYNVPLNSNDGTVSSDVDLDVTMTSPGAYSATISYGMEGNAIGGATVTATTPLFNVSVGALDARGGANAGADASDLYSDIDHMTDIGKDEDNSDWYVALPNFGGWTVAASGKSDMTSTAAKNSTSIGLTGSVGGLSVTAGGMHKDAGVSVSTQLMGATVKVAAASIYSTAKAKNVQESGVQVDMPLGVGGMNLSVNSTTTDGNSNWGASVSTKLAGYDVSAGTDSDEDHQIKITGPLGPVNLHLEWDSTDGPETTAVDKSVEAGVTYNVPGTNGTSIAVSYSNTDDDFDKGTQVKMAFKF